MTQGRLIVVGYGNMGKAVVGGVLRAEHLQPAQVVVIDPHALNQAPPGSGVHEGIAQWLRIDRPTEHDTVLLAVKPQIFPQIAPLIATAWSSGRGPVWASVMAGIDTRRIQSAFGRSGAVVVRAMPNLPARVGSGVTAICGGEHAHQADVARIRELFACVGPMVYDLPEDQFDAFTAVAGSGPAYLFYLAESMAAGALAAGLEPTITRAVVRQTLIGAAELLASDPDTPPELLRQAVTSKGGTTQAACVVLDVRQVHDAFSAAIVAARDRGRELSRG